MIRAKGEWLNDNTSTNESGFAALPAGSRLPGGAFMHAGSLDPALANSYESTAWWTPIEVSKKKAKAYVLDHKGTWGQVKTQKGHGYSVRLIKKDG